MAMMKRLPYLRMFRREYFHLLRNMMAEGKVERPSQTMSETAADTAVARVKDQCWKDLKERTDMTSFDKDEFWSTVLEQLVEFQIMLVNLPLDPNRADEIPRKNDT